MFYNFVKGITGWLLKILYPYEVVNMPELEDKAYLLVANHKSNWDPLFVSILFPKQVRWMAKRELFEKPILKQILQGVGAISVDRDHGDAKSTIIAMRALKERDRGHFSGGNAGQGRGLRPGQARHHSSRHPHGNRSSAPIHRRGL